MAYEMTCYLNWDSPSPTRREVASLFARLEGMESPRLSLPYVHPENSGLHQTRTLRWDNVLDGDVPHKWDNHQHQFARMSTFWPNTLFVLDCHEDHPYREYYRNGRVQRVVADVMYPDFDAAELAPVQHPGKGAPKEDLRSVIYAVTVQDAVDAYDELARIKELPPWEELDPSRRDAYLLAVYRGCWFSLSWTETMTKFFEHMFETSKG